MQQKFILSQLFENQKPKIKMPAGHKAERENFLASATIGHSLAYENTTLILAFVALSLCLSASTFLSFLL